MPVEQCFSHIMASISYFQRNDDENDAIRFVLDGLDQHDLLNIYSASQLKQHSTGGHVSPLGHVIYHESTCIAEKQQKPII